MIQIPRLLVICGDSMYPTYKDGEYLISLPVRFSKINVGDVLIFKTPYDPKRVVIKRVNMISTFTKELFFLGDNLDNSYDSRNYGFIPYKNVLGKLVQQRKKGDQNGE